MKRTSGVPTEADVRRVLAAGLRTKREEIEAGARAHVDRILATKEISDPQYTQGLREAISAGLGFSLALIEDGERETPPIPAPLLAQARLAARNGLELGIVLRRYVAGYTLLDEFIAQEAAGAGIGADAMTPVLRTQRQALNQLLGKVNEEYAREAAFRLASSEERLARQIQRMLDGELIDTSKIPYDFDGQHLGIFTTGAEGRSAVQALARRLDRNILVTTRSDGIVHAWLGSRKIQSWTAIKSLLDASWPTSITVAFGEPAVGRNGWRRTHEQARAAFSIASRLPDRIVRYADVALEASMSQDDLLVLSLREIYLDPLAGRRDATKIRKAIRAYLDANGSVTDAATMLKIGRPTVTRRVQAYERLVGRSLDACGEAVRAALRLEEIGYVLEAG